MTLVSTLRAFKHRLVYGPQIDPRKEAARTRRRQRRTYQAVRKQLALPQLPTLTGALCGIAMVKNEADIVERTMRQLLAQGVDELLVADNGSTDGTLELLEELQREMPIHIARDSMSAYEQSVKMTVLADAVTDRGCAWVLPFDADELWMGKNGKTVREVLLSTNHDIVAADLFNVFPRLQGGTTWNLDPASHPDRKISFRSRPGAVLQMGNHGVLRPGTTGEGLAIVHLPWRSFEQFDRKIVQGAKALEETSLSEDKGWHWRQLGREDASTRLRTWTHLLSGDAIPGNAWSAENATIPFDIVTLAPLPWDLGSDNATLTGRTGA